MTPLMALRREAGLSRKELARLTGRCVRVLADIERDTHNLPWSFAERVAVLLSARLGRDVNPYDPCGMRRPSLATKGAGGTARRLPQGSGER